MPQGRLAAVDLGTNSCRLKITDSQGVELYRDSVATKLGEGLIKNHTFTAEAVERGLKCLSTYAQKMREYAVKDYRAVATAACRDAANGANFIRSIEELCGLKMDVITAKEEALLNIKGARQNADSSLPFFFVYDLGGGSTELTLATNEENPRILYTISVPWGARTASEAFDLLEYDVQKAQKLHDEIKKYTQEFLINSEFAMYRDQCSCIATSSTPLRLVHLSQNSTSYKRENADGVTMPVTDYTDAIERVWQSSFIDMTSNPCIGENRAPIFVAGCVIFRTIYEELQLTSLTASLKGAMEAIIEDLVQKWQHN